MTNKASVIDSSALLAIIYDEDGNKEVQKYFDQSYMSVINAAECLIVLNRNGMPMDVAKNLLESIINKFIPTEYNDTSLIADIKNSNLDIGLSFADCACISLGDKLGLQIVTADRVWTNAKCKSNIICIR